MLYEVNYNKNIPVMLEEDPAVRFLPKPKAPYYTIQAAGRIPSKFTGRFLGNIIFVDGIAYAKKFFDVRLSTIRGCRDITDEEMKKELSARPLSKILVVRAAAFGDCTIVTPALKALRAKYPDATIHVFGRKDSKVVYQNLPFIDGIVGCRDIELATLIDSYDEVYDMVHSIECRPEADYENALDVAVDIMGLEVTDPQPGYVISASEIEEAKQLLIDLGVHPSDSGIIVMQREATAAVRTLSPDTTWKVANHFAEKGHKVILVGHRQETTSIRSFVCSECGNHFADIIPYHIESIEHNCKSCKNKCKAVAKRMHPNIVFAHRLNAKYKARVHFAIAHFASLIIAVDSFWAHLAAALNKKSVLMFTNYHAYTRTKYYSRSSVVTVDYKKKAPCGPCNSLYDQCSMYPGTPPCADIDPEKIIKEAEKRLDGLLDIYSVPRDLPLASMGEVRNCPCCDAEGDPKRPITCKGEFIYVECPECGTYYTAKYPDLNFWSEMPTLIKGRNGYRPDRNINLMEYIQAVQNVMKAQGKPAPAIPIVDLVGFSDGMVGRERWAKKYAGHVVEKSEKLSTALEAELVLWVDGIMESKDIKRAIEKQLSRMKLGSYLCVVTPMSNQFVGMASWAPLNAVVAGLHTVIPSHKGFSMALESTSRGKLLTIATAPGKTSLLIIEVTDGTQEETPSADESTVSETCSS